MIKFTVGVEGMVCNMCEAHINEAIRNAFLVKKVASSHSKKQTVIITEDEIDEQKLKDVIINTGYEVVSINKEPYKKKGLFSVFEK